MMIANKTPPTPTQPTRMWSDSCERQIRCMALRFTTNQSQLEDLMQVGRIELLKASRRFDPTKGAKLFTYAYLGIRGAMSRYVLNELKHAPMQFPAEEAEGPTSGTYRAAEYSHGVAR